MTTHDIKSDYKATFSLVEKATGDTVYFQMDIDTYELGKHMAVRALESKTGKATAKGGTLRVQVVGRQKKEPRK